MAVVDVESHIAFLLTNALGASVNGVFPSQVEQTISPPYVVYLTKRIDPNGDKTQVSQLDELEIIILSIAQDFTTARTNANTIRTTLDKYDATEGTNRMQSFFDDENQYYDSKSEFYHIEQDYKIFNYR